jgi:hypothetical protein
MDKDCHVTNLLNKSVLAMQRLNKCRKDTAGLGIKEVENDIIGILTGLYREEISQNQWKQAASHIDILMTLRTHREYLIDRAACAYALHDKEAIGNVSRAIRFNSGHGNNDTAENFAGPYGLLRQLQASGREKEFNQLFDTLIYYFPTNSILLTDIYNNLLVKWHRYRREYKFDSLLDYSGYLKKCYPGNGELKLQISQAVLAAADSLAGIYAISDTAVAAVLTCLDLLAKARAILGEYVTGLNMAAYYTLRPNKTITFGGFSSFSENLEFSTRGKSSRDYHLDLNPVKTLVPGWETGSITGYIWNNVPVAKRAKSQKDQIRKETLNYFLLDTLTHALCNRFRRENQRPRLKWNNNYYRASRHHALVMASQNAIWHGEDTESDYADPDSVKMYMSMFQGENVQFIGLGSQSYTYEKLANDIIENWKSSPGHRKNMLEDYSFESVSTVIASSYYLYAVLTDERITAKYLSEYKKFFDIFPNFKTAFHAYAEGVSRPTSFSSQNFPYIGR